MTTHLTSPGRNTTMVTNTGMKALMPKPTQPHTKTVVRIASSGMAESCGTPQAHHQRRHEGEAEHVDAVLDHGDGGGRRGGDALAVHVVDLHGLPARRKGGDALVKLAHQRHLRSLAEGQRVAARLAQNGEFERFHHEHDDEQRRHGQQQPPVHAAHHLGKGGGVTPGERLAELKQHRNDAGDDDGGDDAPDDVLAPLLFEGRLGILPALRRAAPPFSEADNSCAAAAPLLRKPATLVRKAALPVRRAAPLARRAAAPYVVRARKRPLVYVPFFTVFDF